MGDISIDSESFAKAFNCLNTANSMIEEGLGNFNELNSSALSLIDSINTQNATKLDFFDTECSSLYQKMRSTIQLLIEMDSSSAEIFSNSLSNDAKSSSGLLDTLNRINATASMVSLNFTEGVFTAGEEIVDGFATIGGFVAGLFSKDAQKSISDWIEKDHVGDWFDRQFSEGGWFYDVSENSYFSHDSTAAKIIKGVGTAAGYVGVLATGVGGTGIVTEMTVSGLGGIGRATQDALQTGATFEEASGAGVRQGAKDAALTGVLSKAIRVLGSARNATGAADDAVNAVVNSADEAGTGMKLLTGSTDDVVSAAANSTDDLLKSSSNFADDAADAIIYDKNGVKIASVKGDTVVDFSGVDDVTSTVGNFSGKKVDLSNAQDAVFTVVGDDAGNVASTVANSADDFSRGVPALTDGTSGTLARVANSADDFSRGVPTLTDGTSGTLARVANSADDFSRGVPTRGVPILTDGVVDATASGISKVAGPTIAAGITRGLSSLSEISTSNDVSTDNIVFDNTPIVPSTDNVDSGNTPNTPLVDNIIPGNTQNSGVGSVGNGGALGGTGGSIGTGENHVVSDNISSVNTNSFQNNGESYTTIPSNASNSIINSPNSALNSYNNSIIDSYNNSIIDSYNDSVIDSYNVTDSYNTTNNYYNTVDEQQNSDSSSDGTLKTILGIGAASLAGVATAAGYSAYKDKKDKKKDDYDI